MAGLVGIEPTVTVLETAVLPLYDSPSAIIAAEAAIKQRDLYQKYYFLAFFAGAFAAAFFFGAAFLTGVEALVAPAFKTRIKSDFFREALFL